jgi:hypothetical protein
MVRQIVAQMNKPLRARRRSAPPPPAESPPAPEKNARWKQIMAQGGVMDIEQS